MIKYHQESIDFKSLHPNNIDRMQLSMVPANSRLLEIGCATGSMNEYLTQEQGCAVLAVEADHEQAEAARRRGIEVLTGFVDDPLTTLEIDRYPRTQGLFEVVFMSQVIVHIVDPAATLNRLKRNKKLFRHKHGHGIIADHWRIKNLHCLKRYAEEETHLGTINSLRYKFRNRLTMAEELIPNSPIKKLHYYRNIRKTKLLFIARFGSYQKKNANTP